MSSVTIPRSVTDIGYRAFLETQLTNIMVPDSVTNIGFEAFEYCSNLKAITVDSNNTVYSSLGGVLFDKNQSTLIQYPPGAGGAYTIPDGVTRVGEEAFDGCSNLTKLTIPGSVRVIGNQALGLCSGLTNVIFPDSITDIGSGAFYNCTGLTTLTIPNNVTDIGSEAFFECAGLASVTIGDGVSSIGDEAFADCASLTVIIVVSNNPFYSGVDGVLFDKAQTTLIQYPPAKAGNYAVPNGVTAIGNGAFALCSALTNIMFPDGLVSIGDAAFYFCSSLRSATFPSSVTYIGDSAFFACSGLRSLYFKGDAPFADYDAFVTFYFDGYEEWDATAYFLPGTDGWNDFFASTYTRTELWKPLIQNGDAGFGVRTNQFGFNITWVSGQIVVVDACTNLVSPNWSPIATNVLPADSSVFSDPQWTNYPARFYRLRSP
jgi:hypothetical protein